MRLRPETASAAIQEANALAGADQIILPPNTYLLTQVTDLTIGDNLTITGGGESTTIIDGNGTLRSNRGVLSIASGRIVNISGVTIRNGRRQNGAGILNRGALTLTNSTVTGNTATDFGGGGIFNFTTVTLINSTVSGNIADESGGGISNNGALTLTDGRDGAGDVHRDQSFSPLRGNFRKLLNQFTILAVYFRFF